MKTGRFSEKEKTYIAKNFNKTNQDISKKLDRSVESIQKYKDSINTVKHPEPIKDVVPFIPVKNLFGRSSNAIIATQAMSEVSDSIKAKKVDNPCIFRINQPKK